MKTINELEVLIIEWAEKRNLIKYENADKQKLKLIEELGELSRAVLKNEIEEQKDAIGDIFVVLTILRKQLGKESKEVYLEMKSTIQDSIYAIINISFLSYLDFNLSISHLNNISKILGHDLTECVNLAYETIKDRKGITVNGTFIKSE